MNECEVYGFDYEISHISFAGYLKAGDKYNSDKGHKLVYISNGECTVYINKEKHLLTSGNLMLIKHGDSFVVKKVTDSVGIILVEYYTECEYEFPVLYENPSSLIKNLLEKMIKEYENREYAFEIHLKSLLYEILGRVIRGYYFDKFYTGDYRKVHNSVAYLKENFLDKDMRMEEVAEASGLSLSYFRKLFLKVYKISPRTYISNLRMHKADELLKYTTMSISEISETLKFENQYSFSNFYKKHKGISPQKYRNMQVENNVR